MPKEEKRSCQNCHGEFLIDASDFEFYDKIKVPPPTWCPECRLMRRFTWRNERSLYRRQCDLCRNSIIARFPSSAPFPVYCRTCWYSDKWDPADYGQEYDYKKPFLIQFSELLNRVPHPAVAAVNTVNSEYCAYGADIKNVYLSASAVNSEDIYYSSRIDYSRYVFSSSYGRQLDGCVDVIDAVSASQVASGRYIKNTMESQLLYDVHNVNHCLGCINLRNGKFMIMNQQYSEEDYKKRLQDYDLGNYQSREAFQQKFIEFALKFPRRFAAITKSHNVIGDNVADSKDCHFCFDTFGSENCKYLFAAVGDSRDSYDISFVKSNELCYEATSCQGSKNKFGHFAWGQSSLEYVYSSANMLSSYLFGCASIPHKKNYCILNKQYSVEEYKVLVEKIKKDMTANLYLDARGISYPYGENFPPELSPFAYNETIAQEYFPLSKEEALSQGYRWKDTEEKSYNITITNDQLPDHIKDTQDSILNETIGCSHQGKCNEQCSTGFRIIQQELELYRKMNLPLPRLCPNCRHYQRLKQRNPLKLWHRKCQCSGQKSSNGVYSNTVSHFHGSNPCPNEFETSYAPERPEIVYCEQCYQAEVV